MDKLMPRGEPDGVVVYWEELARDTERLAELRNSKPQLTDKQKDECYKVYKELSKEIRDNLFMRTDMEKGLADPHQELKRQTTPRISTNGRIEMFQNLGIKVSDGKISRNQATGVWKIIGRLLGEATNAERLRRDKISSTYHSEKRLDGLL